MMDTNVAYADYFTITVFFLSGLVFYAQAYRNRSFSSKQSQSVSREVILLIKRKAALLNGLSSIITFISATCILIGRSKLIDVEVDGQPINVARYIDWIITCPLLQIQLGVIADKANLQPILMVFHVFFTNLGGLLAALSTSHLWKLVFFLFSCFHFIMMAVNLHFLIRKHTNGSESLFTGTSSLRSLCLLTVITWVPFPILWVLSPDGFELSNLGEVSEILFNLIGLLAKLSVQSTIAIRRLEFKVIEEAFEEESSSIGSSSVHDCNRGSSCRTFFDDSRHVELVLMELDSVC
ncbi:hypothetical protein GEMRC1_006068 [Eukaryota sp. GEM-RC1]